jgi:hypothetical protein
VALDQAFPGQLRISDQARLWFLSMMQEMIMAQAMLMMTGISLLPMMKNMTDPSWQGAIEL